MMCISSSWFLNVSQGFDYALGSVIGSDHGYLSQRFAYQDVG